MTHIEGLISAEPAVHAPLPKVQGDAARTQGWSVWPCRRGSTSRYNGIGGCRKWGGLR